MGNIKGSIIMYIRQEIDKQGEMAKNKLSNVLSLNLLDVFRKTMAIQWLPIENFAEIVKAAAPILYPRDNQAIRKLGHDLAQNDLKGIYKILMRFTTVAYILGQAKKLWSTYHQAGSPRVEPVNAKAFNFVVEDYPSAPPVFLEFMIGYIAGTLEFSAVKNIKIVLDNTNINAWKWMVTWD